MKQAIIYFSENLSKGSLPRMKKIAMYIDMDRRSLRLDNLLSSRNNASFVSRYHPSFDKLRSLLNHWVSGGVESTTHRRFQNLQEWSEWKKTVYFDDDEIHWKVFIQHDDGTWSLYLELGMCFPKELEQIYRTALRMRQ